MGSDTNKKNTLGVSEGEDFLKEIGFAHMTPMEQGAFVEESSLLVFELALSEAIKNMSDECLEAYGRMMDKDPSPEEMMAFLRAVEPDFDDMFKEEGEKLREAITSDIRAVMPPNE